MLIYKRKEHITKTQEATDMFKVYGADLTKAIAEFDTINEAMVYAKKGLRNNGHGRSIKDTQFKMWLYKTYKRNGIVKVVDLR